MMRMCSRYRQEMLDYCSEQGSFPSNTLLVCLFQSAFWCRLVGNKIVLFCFETTPDGLQGLYLTVYLEIAPGEAWWTIHVVGRFNPGQHIQADSRSFYCHFNPSLLFQITNIKSSYHNSKIASFLAVVHIAFGQIYLEQTWQCSRLTLTLCSGNYSWFSTVFYIKLHIPYIFHIG